MQQAVSSRIGATAQPGADGAGQIGEDAEDADLDDRPAEHAGGVDAAKGIERVERVAIEHGRQQEAEIAAVRRQAAQRAPEMGEPLPDRALA